MVQTTHTYIQTTHTYIRISALPGGMVDGWLPSMRRRGGIQAIPRTTPMGLGDLGPIYPNEVAIPREQYCSGDGVGHGLDRLFIDRLAPE